MKQLPITEDQERILMHIFDRVGPDGDFSVEEKLEMALDTLLNSYDSTVDAESEQEMSGQPVDAAQLRAAVMSTLNPNIGTDFQQPAEVEKSEHKDFTFDELKKIDPTNGVFEWAEGEPVLPAKEACVLVFNQLPRKDWRGPNVKDLIAKAIVHLQDHVPSKNSP